jgi:LmbE family N-acetylglucosaminyl deacetylase
MKSVKSGQRAPDLLSRYAGKTVLAVGAHPDDLELGVGGTLAGLSRSGARVVMAVLSVPNNLKARRAEARKAAEILGCELRLPKEDRCFRVEDMKSHELVSVIDGLVKEFSPDAMFSHCLANLHLDHKLAYEACMASQRLRYFDIFCYSPTSCHAVNIAFHPHAYIDISHTIDAKMAAIRIHSTQFDRRGLQTEHYRESSNRTGGVIGVEYAEGLEVVRMRLN